jgi:hypothetical protein
VKRPVYREQLEYHPKWPWSLLAELLRMFITKRPLLSRNHCC